MSAPTHITTHAADALALLTSSSQGRTNTEAILRAFANRTQELEDAIWGAIQALQLSNSPTGAWLDILGEIAGEPRLARGDVDYLLAVKVALRANRSQGTAEDIIQILTLLGVTFAYTEDPNAPLSWRADVFGLPSGTGSGIMGPLGRAKMATSSGYVATTFRAQSIAMRWDRTAWGSTRLPPTANYPWGHLQKV